MHLFMILHVSLSTVPYVMLLRLLLSSAFLCVFFLPLVGHALELFSTLVYNNPRSADLISGCLMSQLLSYKTKRLRDV